MRGLEDGDAVRMSWSVGRRLLISRFQTVRCTMVQIRNGIFVIVKLRK